jgi:hypothetical protein
VQKDDDLTTTPDESKVVLSDRLREFVDILRRDYHPQMSEDDATPSALEEVEQQREVSVESQEEREMQRPSSAQALAFPGLHRLIRDFVKSGFLDGGGICPNASTILTSTRLWRKQPMRSCSMMSHLFLSPEFVRTVRLDIDHDPDNFLVSLRSWQQRTSFILTPSLASCQLGTSQQRCGCRIDHHTGRS